MDAAPSVADVSTIMDGTALPASTNGGKGGSKGKRSARKGKGKGDADPTNNGNGNGNGNGETSEPATEAVTTPLMEAKALAKAVLLDSC